MTMARGATPPPLADGAGETTPLPRRLPGAGDFADYPAAWYWLGATRDLDTGPLARRMLGGDFVAYRTPGGQVVVMDARCSHLGADLGRGTVVGDCIQCPFHGWRYAPDGRCVHVPQAGAVPRRARQRVYPAVERHGMVFVFNGLEPLFPLPFFFGERPEEFVAGAPVDFVASSTWFMVAAHGYDTQHFETVHSRRLHGPLLVDTPAPFARRSRYTADVVGTAYYDRLLRRCAGPTVEISITTWGGTLVLITGQFRRASSRFMIALEPLEGGQTRCRVLVFARRAGGALRRCLRPLDLGIRRHLTRAYLVDEVQSLGSPRYNPTNFSEGDREMIEYFRWAAALPAPGYQRVDATSA
jgi:nitrite reductase/ring-hydroxylating ferredoxin subunit